MAVGLACPYDTAETLNNAAAIRIFLCNHYPLHRNPVKGKGVGSENLLVKGCSSIIIGEAAAGFSERYKLLQR